ncbi:bifunctional Dihydroorotase homodimeric type/Metal-dependent hydrolase/Amidohydrolase-related [Babesia duncani]|uniref:dihydroorotase n=1 Tax=Babesia duncani TaxID=323732 RepID=A0AAD9PKU1_9APIC|nr:bifunctional Dihydroorotase homodimeric type/Metal-dependent hydrolase/Amidohydrolase-related [Babesia duncani]
MVRVVNTTSHVSNRVLVMPNLVPPITTCKQALEYHEKLVAIEPKVTFLMTLYLSLDVNAQDLEANAKKSHVKGLKCYPFGVTTNSSSGVDVSRLNWLHAIRFQSLEPFHHIFKTMESLDLSLHIHCESPGINPLNAERDYMPNVERIAKKYPRLKIVVEHASTKEALDLVYKYPNVGATITPQHLMFTIHDIVDSCEALELENLSFKITNPHLFCKPIYKDVQDLQELTRVMTIACNEIQGIVSRHPRLFLGSDSAPHLKIAKASSTPPAGVYTQPFIINVGSQTRPLTLQYYATIFDRLGCLDYLEAFAACNGAAFLNLPQKDVEYIEIQQKTVTVSL